MYATLFAPDVSMARLLEIACGFTPRFQVVGPLVLLDASGVSRLFGDAHVLAQALDTALEHAALLPATPLHSALPHAAPGVRHSAVALAHTATASMLLALGRNGITMVDAGAEAAHLAPLSIDVLTALARARLQPETPVPTADPRSTTGQAEPGMGWHHPRDTHQAQHTRRAARASARPSALSSAPLSARPSAPLSAPLSARSSAPPSARSPARPSAPSVLHLWGIRTLGALAALPRPDVHARLGELGVAWQRLAAGEDDLPLVPWMAEPVFEEMMELEWPVEGLEPLSFVLARLLEPLAARLERADRGAVVVRTALRLTTRAMHMRAIPLPAPMRDPKTLRTLVLLDLESHPPPAAIDRVHVCLDPSPGRVLQWTLFERAQPAPEQVSTLLARLTALAGEGHVGSPALVDTWKPGAFEMRPFAPPAADAVNGERDTSNVEPDRVSASCAFRRFRLPIPVRVRVEDGRPIRITTDRRGVTGGVIVQAAGPWRTSGEWWRGGFERKPGDDRPASTESSGTHDTRVPPVPQRPERSRGAWDHDEWDIAMTDGTIYRLAVEREVGQWYLEGIVD